MNNFLNNEALIKTQFQNRQVGWTSKTSKLLK